MIYIVMVIKSILAYLSAVLVHLSLDVDGHCAGALVEDRELRLVVEQACHLHME